MFRFRAIILATIAIMLSIVAFNPSSASASIVTPYSASASYAHFSVVKPAISRYTVKTGDSLSRIAENNGGTWPQWYCANTETIGKNPNVITTGESLIKPSPDYRASCPLDIPQTQGGNSSSGNATPITQAAVAPVSAPVPDPSPQGSSDQSQPVDQSYSGSSSMQECIISRESGGNADIWNPSGHWGLYQFSEGTWVFDGGSPSTFGNASIAEQNQVFSNAVASSGYSAWAPYDGC